MRARSFRPSLESLDFRLLLDASTGTMLGPSVGATVLAGAASSGTPTDTMPDDGTDSSGQLGWLVAGNPPPVTYDPSAPPAVSDGTSSN